MFINLLILISACNEDTFQCAVNASISEFEPDDLVICRSNNDWCNTYENCPLGVMRTLAVVIILYSSNSNLI